MKKTSDIDSFQSMVDDILAERVDGAPNSRMTDLDWKTIREEGRKRAEEWHGRFPLEERQILEAIGRARLGISRYLEIMRMFPEVNVAEDAYFHRR